MSSTVDNLTVHAAIFAMKECALFRDILRCRSAKSSNVFGVFVSFTAVFEFVFSVNYYWTV